MVVRNVLALPNNSTYSIAVVTVVVGSPRRSVLLVVCFYRHCLLNALLGSAGLLCCRGCEEG
jgi:hypothetical protein